MNRLVFIVFIFYSASLFSQSLWIGYNNGVNKAASVSYQHKANSVLSFTSGAGVKMTDSILVDYDVNGNKTYTTIMEYSPCLLVGVKATSNTKPLYIVGEFNYLISNVNYPMVSGGIGYRYNRLSVETTSLLIKQQINYAVKVGYHFKSTK